MKAEKVGLQTKKKYLKARYKQCELCGDGRSLEVHHIIPKCLGGSDDADNLLVVCRRCHALLTPKKELARLAAKPKAGNNCMRKINPRTECKRAIMHFLTDLPIDYCMYELDLYLKCQGFSKSTIARAKSDLKKQGAIEAYNTGYGSSKKWFIKATRR